MTGNIARPMPSAFAARIQAFSVSKDKYIKPVMHKLITAQALRTRLNLLVRSTYAEKKTQLMSPPPANAIAVREVAIELKLYGFSIASMTVEKTA